MLVIYLARSIESRLAIYLYTSCTCIVCTCYIISDLEWKIIYVGSAESEEYDQVLDTVLVGPLVGGKHKFVFQVRAIPIFTPLPFGHVGYCDYHNLSVHPSVHTFSQCRISSMHKLRNVIYYLTVT